MWPKSKPAVSSRAATVARPVAQPPARPHSVAPQMYAGFDCIAADDARYSHSEPWSGAANKNLNQLPYIPAEGSLPFVDLPAKLKEMMDHCWKIVRPNTAAPRSQVQVGAARATTPRTPAEIFAAHRMKERGQYTPQVAPLNPADSIFAQDWKLTEQLERVNAYTFRGDRRTPREVEAAKGFFPPISRTDQHYVETVVYPKFAEYLRRRVQMQLSLDQFQRVYGQATANPQDRDVLKLYFSWRAMVETESHHIGRMTASEILKNYISTSKDIGKAKQFAKEGGWVFVTRVRGGFHLSSDHLWGQTFIQSEQEIALPGGLEWSEVFGFRQQKSGFLAGPLYMRKGFREANPAAYDKVFQFMSNKHPTK